MSFIVDFISERLALFFSSLESVKRSLQYLIIQRAFYTVSIDIDISENLSIPIKYELQSLHWRHSQVIVHSGIMKNAEEKYYHAYFSDDRKHDQAFVKLAMEEMLNEAEIDSDKYIIIESDNCSSQYK